MEESLKARLIGAAVLVALAVLLVPVLLSGRKSSETAPVPDGGVRGTRTFTIELEETPGQAGRNSPTSVAGPAPGALPAVRPATTAEGPRGADVKVTASLPEPDVKPAPVVDPRGEGPEPAVARETSSSAPAPAPRDPPPAATGGWLVQVGAFGSADSARKLARELSSAGFRAFVSPVTRSGKTLHRVRVGPEADRAGAEQLARRLEARKLPATVVRND